MKSWFTSKTVWLGILQTLIGALALVADFITKGAFEPQDFVLLFSGVLMVVIRIWFTNTTLSARSEALRVKDVEAECIEPENKVS